MSTQGNPEQTAAFNLEQKSCFYLSDSDFRKGTRAVYGKGIEIIESPNDTTHEYQVSDEEPILFDEDTLKDAISGGCIEAHLVDVVLHDLHKRGVLPAGDYFIRVSW